MRRTKGFILSYHTKRSFHKGVVLDITVLWIVKGKGRAGISPGAPWRQSYYGTNSNTVPLLDAPPLPVVVPNKEAPIRITPPWGLDPSLLPVKL